MLDRLRTARGGCLFVRFRNNGMLAIVLASQVKSRACSEIGKLTLFLCHLLREFYQQSIFAVVQLTYVFFHFVSCRGVKFLISQLPTLLSARTEPFTSKVYHFLPVFPSVCSCCFCVAMCACRSSGNGYNCHPTYSCDISFFWFVPMQHFVWLNTLKFIHLSSPFVCILNLKW